jgi:hypothetical protein
MKSISNKPMTEGKEYDSGLFDRAEEARVISENPQLAAGKNLMKAAIESAIGEFDEVQDLIEAMKKVACYDVVFNRGYPYLKMPNGMPERVSVYINRLEKSLIVLSQKLAKSDQICFEQAKELEKYREVSKPVTKRKYTKRKAK